ncbi:unnamed protein product [Clonostachys byssicola]|uniref:Zn(2)-C6 fungal-type domain-containing protein n=1 Tax=Clonostachys byssicola TaxID=160290 RepID=A0A9N9XXB7_9HYPO|nr:unnamed protein product [Clonostachys byssicola]
MPPLPAHRQRVSRACDLCKKRKIRCTGDRPCQLCFRDNLECRFDAPYARGKNKKKRTPKNEANKVLSSICTKGVSVVQACSPVSHSTVASTSIDETSQLRDLLEQPENKSSGGTVQDPTPIGDSLPLEPGQADRLGHFVGESSGLSFLIRLRRRLVQDTGSAYESSVFTLGDPELPIFDENAFSWPPREEADRLVNTFFELTSATYRYLHRPTVEGWIRQFYDDGDVSEPYSHGKKAVLLGLFAQASGYSQNTPAVDGLRYFQASEKELNRQTQPTHLTTVQALLLACFFTLTCSRLNHCWSLFGTTARLILALGLHRRRRNKIQQKDVVVDWVQVECGKRLFWSAYTLDKYLAAIFGRPCALSDDETDQDFPAVVDDHDLTSLIIKPAVHQNMNKMLAPICHHKLGRILCQALKRLYGIVPLDRAKQYQAMSELGAMVREWRDSLPYFLDPQKVDSRILRPFFQRQSNLLSLGSGHLEILIYRPCLLSEPDETDISIELQMTSKANIQSCLDAAMSIVATIDAMVENDQFYAISWFAHYQAFCAVLVLYTYTIKSKLKPSSSWLSYYQAAERCQGLIAAVPKTDSLARRLHLIMEEYRAEVVRQVQWDSPQGMIPSNSPPLTSNLDITTNWLALADGNEESLPLTDLPNWEQLDSLALDTWNVDFDLGLSSAGIE